MKVLIVGAGGREHALASKINQSPIVDKVYAIPGNDAMVNIAEVHSEIAESDHQAILHFAQHNAIDWVIIGPEQPLIDGLADLLRNANIKVFGPGQDAAQIEGSKLFAKQLMDKYRIPTAEYKEVSSRNEALQYVETCDLPIVIKERRFSSR